MKVPTYEKPPDTCPACGGNNWNKYYCEKNPNSWTSDGCEWGHGDRPKKGWVKGPHLHWNCNVCQYKFLTPLQPQETP